MQTQVINPSSYSRDEWRGGFQSLPQEHGYWIESIEGEIPQDLYGTLYRNGPGLLDVNGQAIAHPFDGDGMICAFGFADGKAYFQNRFVQTPGYLAEKDAGKILYRGVFGTQKPGGWLANCFDLRLKHIANTNVMHWNGKLLALWEAAEPYQLDPKTLETLGPDYLDGIIPENGAFAAHPRFDPGLVSDQNPTGQPRLVNFAVKPGLSSQLTIYEFDLAGKLLQKQVRTFPGFAFLHDFVITPNYYVFFQNPVQFNPLPFLFGWKGAGQCLNFLANQPTQVLMIPRNSAQPIQTFPADACFVFHHANAFETEQTLVIDSICYAGFPSVDPGLDYQEIDFDTLPPGQLWRFQVDLETGTTSRCLLEERCCEFPVLNPNNVGRDYQYVYVGAAQCSVGNAPNQVVEKLNVKTSDRQLWSAAPHGFVSEPIFVPHPSNGTEMAEDAGWLLVLVYDGQRHGSDLVILDAQDLTQGAIARLHLKHHIPYGLHGSFTPAVVAMPTH